MYGIGSNGVQCQAGIGKAVKDLYSLLAPRHLAFTEANMKVLRIGGGLLLGRRVCLCIRFVAWSRWLSVLSTVLIDDSTYLSHHLRVISTVDVMFGLEARMLTRDC